jgi:hypothetical protein
MNLYVFYFFYIVTYGCSSPEEDISVILKSGVCVTSDDGKVQIFISDFSRVTPLSDDYSEQLNI